MTLPLSASLCFPQNVLARIDTISHKLFWKRKYKKKKTIVKIKRGVLSLDVNEGEVQNHQHRTLTEIVPYKMSCKVIERQRIILVRYSSRNI